MSLEECEKPKGKLEPVAELPETELPGGWRVMGVRDEEGNLDERDGEVRWLRIEG